MPAVAELGLLKEARKQMPKANPDDPMVKWLRAWGTKIGWKNACHMLIIGRTPEQIKGLEL